LALDPMEQQQTWALVRALARLRVETPGIPDWRHDPSYFWADQVKAKAKRSAL
jgi:hypothetical protein